VAPVLGLCALQIGNLPKSERHKKLCWGLRGVEEDADCASLGDAGGATTSSRVEIERFETTQNANANYFTR